MPPCYNVARVGGWADALFARDFRECYSKRYGVDILNMQRTGLYVLLTFLLLAATLPLAAQDGDNLLKDGDFEGQYTGRGAADFNIPADWGVWFADSPRTEVWMNLQPVAFPHGGPDPDPQSGRRALNLNKGYATFTAAVYQQVSVAEGTNVQASAYAYLHTCNIPKNSDKCGSAVESGAFTKIGIDPNGGTNPYDSDIVWSGEIRPHDRWEEMSVSATATGGTVTVFLYVTQQMPSDLNKVYFDNARLRAGGEGGAAPAGGGDGAPAPTAIPQSVGFVSPQEAREDGSIVHTVRSGDTIDSIAVAYGLTRQDILDLNNISDPRIIQVGQELLIREARRGNRNNNNDNDDEGGAAETAAPAETENEGGEVEASAEASGEEAAAATEEGGEDAAAEESGGDEGEREENARPPQESAPPAPVVANALPARDPAATTATICVIMFDDVNQNRIQEDGEAPLAGGQITLNREGSAVSEFTTENAATPHCVSDLQAGEYLAVAAAPDGYGLTTPNQLRVRASAGATIHVAFGAAEGVVVAMVPPPDDLTVVSEEVAEEPAAVTPPNPIAENSGLIVLGLAGVVLVVGMGATLLMRRR